MDPARTEGVEGQGSKAAVLGSTRRPVTKTVRAQPFFKILKRCGAVIQEAANPSERKKYPMRKRWAKDWFGRLIEMWGHTTKGLKPSPAGTHKNIKTESPERGSLRKGALNRSDALHIRDTCKAS